MKSSMVDPKAMEAELIEVHQRIKTEGKTAELASLKRDLEWHLQPYRLCLAHMVYEPCNQCGAYIAGGL